MNEDDEPVVKVEKLLGIHKDKSVIPPGMYCYTIKDIDIKTGRMKTNICPYWSIDESKPYQGNGYCSFLELGDWMENGTSLLFDQCKECGINDDSDDC